MSHGLKRSAAECPRGLEDHESCFLEQQPLLSLRFNFSIFLSSSSPLLHPPPLCWPSSLCSVLGESARWCHRSWKSNKAPVPLLFFQFCFSLSASFIPFLPPPTPLHSLLCPSPSPLRFCCVLPPTPPPPLPPPIPSSSPLSILQPSLEKMRSGAFCPQINRPYSPLSRAAEAASSLYSAVQYVQWGRGRERKRGVGDPGVLACLSNALLRSASQPSVAGRRLK